MNKSLLAVAMAATLGASPVLADYTTNVSFAANLAVPDADVNGLVLSTDLSGLGGPLTAVTISLDISGGFNGDLYSYLVGPNGGFAVLLNRVGVSNNASAFGYNNTGLNVTLDDAATSDVHFYQSAVFTLNGNGQLTGTWKPDGRNLDPVIGLGHSQASDFQSTAPTAMLSSFVGTDPNGTWTLFFADLSVNGQSTVVGASLGLTIVPEPGTGALGLMAAAAFLWRRKTGMRKNFR